MHNKERPTTNNSQANTTKLGCRFTPAEVKLLDILATRQGISTSAFIRSAVKDRLLEDLLKVSGHHSSVRTQAAVDAAEVELEKMLSSLEDEDTQG